MTWIAAALALGVVVLGAYVRLADAGLGCPDWPGCYGHLTVPAAERDLPATAAFPERPFEASKAWKEMIHRYFAGTLGLILIGLAGYALWRHPPGRPRRLPAAIALLVIFQAVLGMWTVTWLLKPLVVTAHLLGGMAVLSLLAWQALREGGYLGGEPDVSAARFRPWALGGLGIVVAQIALGGWTSANYAALACPDFPTCQTQWWPAMSFGDAFVLWRGLGVDYEGGVLDNPARVAIHMTHRLGALVTLIYVGGLAVWLAARARATAVRGLGALMGVVLVTQVALGIGNVVLSLPLGIAAAHNAGAAVLLLTIVAANHALRPPLTAPLGWESARPADWAMHRG